MLVKSSKMQNFMSLMGKDSSLISNINYLGCKTWENYQKQPIFVLHENVSAYCSKSFRHKNQKNKIKKQWNRWLASKLIDNRKLVLNTCLNVFVDLRSLINFPLCITCVWPTDSKCHNFFLIIADLKVDDFFCSTLKFCNNEPGNFESIKTTKEVTAMYFFFFQYLLKQLWRNMRRDVWLSSMIYHWITLQSSTITQLRKCKKPRQNALSQRYVGI